MKQALFSLFKQMKTNMVQENKYRIYCFNVLTVARAIWQEVIIQKNSQSLLWWNDLRLGAHLSSGHFVMETEVILCSNDSWYKARLSSMSNLTLPVTEIICQYEVDRIRLI